MRVCLDTNVLVRIFVPDTPFQKILEALLNGKVSLLVSNEILFEYEEVVIREFGLARWQKIERLLSVISRLHGSVIEVDPQFRFAVVVDDGDDNKFADCAIAGEADFLISDDGHFAPLRNSGYRPRWVTAAEFALEL